MYAVRRFAFLFYFSRGINSNIRHAFAFFRLSESKSRCLPEFSTAVSRQSSVAGTRLDIPRFLPLGVLGGVGSPLGGSAGGTPLLLGGTGTVPAGSASGASGTRSAGEASGAGVPVTRGGLEAGLDGGRALLLGGGLLLLGLVLSLGLGVAVLLPC